MLETVNAPSLIAILTPSLHPSIGVVDPQHPTIQTGLSGFQLFKHIFRKRLYNARYHLLLAFHSSVDPLLPHCSQPSQSSLKFLDCGALKSLSLVSSVSSLALWNHSPLCSDSNSNTAIPQELRLWFFWRRTQSGRRFLPAYLQALTPACHAHRREYQLDAWIDGYMDAWMDGWIWNDGWCLFSSARQRATLHPPSVYFNSSFPN